MLPEDRVTDRPGSVSAGGGPHRTQGRGSPSAEDGSGNYLTVRSKDIKLAAQYAIDSSGTVKAEVGDEPDDRGQLQFIRFLEDYPQPSSAQHCLGLTVLVDMENP